MIITLMYFIYGNNISLETLLQKQWQKAEQKEGRVTT